MIASARTDPMPGRASSSSLDAVFRSTSAPFSVVVLVGVAAGAAGVAAGAAAGLAIVGLSVVAEPVCGVWARIGPLTSAAARLNTAKTSCVIFIDRLLFMPPQRPVWLPEPSSGPGPKARTVLLLLIRPRIVRRVAEGEDHCFLGLIT